MCWNDTTQRVETYPTEREGLVACVGRGVPGAVERLHRVDSERVRLRRATTAVRVISGLLVVVAMLLFVELYALFH